MIVTFLICLVLVTWHSNLNCVAWPNKNPIDVWAKEVKNQLDNLVKEFNEEKQSSKEEKFKEKMQRRLKNTFTNYRNYIQLHEFLDSEKESFMENLKSAIEKELGTFLIEYEFLMMKKTQKGNLGEKFARITELMQKNETYCDIGYIEQLKNELFKNIKKKKLTEKTAKEILAEERAIAQFIESTEKNIFENELKVKIDAFQKTPYVYAGSYITFLEYIQKDWLKMGDMRWGKLGNTLEKLKNKVKEGKKKLKKEGKNLGETLEDLNNQNKKVLEQFEKILNKFKQGKEQLKGIVGKTKDVYEKVITDLESVGFFDAWIFLLAKKGKEYYAEKLKTEEGIIEEEAVKFTEEYIIGVDYEIKKGIIKAKEKVDEAQKFLKKNGIKSK